MLSPSNIFCSSALTFSAFLSSIDKNDPNIAIAHPSISS
jgi:hypothetical protein